MATTTITKHKTRLERSELELAESVSHQFEAFYQTGVILERIRVDREYEDAGYESFEKYMNERQPCGLKKTQAYRIIAATKVRPLLPTDSPTGESLQWTERTIRPLIHKKLSPVHHKRLGKKIATRVKNGAVFSEGLVKQVVDEHLGTKRKRIAKQLEGAQTAPEIVT